MPNTFSSTYTPIAAAGTPGQIKHVARLLATQLAAAGFGPDCTRASAALTSVFNKVLNVKCYEVLARVEECVHYPLPLASGERNVGASRSAKIS